MCVPFVEYECDARSERHQQEIGAGEIAVQSMAPRRVDEAGNAHHDAGGGPRQQKCRDLHRAEESGRMFGLAFVFDPFELEADDGALHTPDDGSALFTEFRRDWQD